MNRLAPLLLLLILVGCRPGPRYEGASCTITASGNVTIGRINVVVHNESHANLQGDTHAPREHD